MQYTDYLAADHARREREQQLLKVYNEHPVGQRSQNLWMHQVDRSSGHKITASDVVWTIVGLAIAAIILILSIWL